ncbi:MAG: hypothetical protein ACYTG0_14735 [Planctomycetota bacterium]
MPVPKRPEPTRSPLAGYHSIDDSDVGEWFTTQVNGVEVRDWMGIWMSSAALCAVCVVILMAFFSHQHPEGEFGE